MNNNEYRKFKDSKPEDTLFRIQTILHDLGINTTYEWSNGEYEGCCSNRVTVYPTSLGTNGKGTDKSYTLTSGYAELIERIQNNILYIGELSQEDQEYDGFLHFPDQKFISFKEIIEQKSAFIEHIFDKLSCENETDKIKVLREYANMKNGTEYECLCIPFADIKENRIVYLPQDLIFSVYGSNGMSAGNTLEEALVQGLSEVFERYVNRKIALEHICPPSVPRDFLEKIASLNHIICEIEQNPIYEVDVKDCSLGRGLPVVAVIIKNKQKGTFGVKFGAHPSFKVALERTLTEAFQGKTLDIFTVANCIGTDQQIFHRDNILNIMKIGNGFYPKELLIGKPDYEFCPPEMEVMDNNGSNGNMLKEMLEKVQMEGCQVFVKDSSYLGFPSYFILVPGMSEMYPIDWLRVREQQTYVRFVKSFGHLQSFTDDEAKRAIRYLSFKENSLLENQIAWITGRPLTEHILGEDMSTPLLKSMCLYQIGEYAQASCEMAKVAEYYEENGKDGKEIFRCCNHYMSYRAMGIEGNEAERLIGELFEKKTAARVSDILSDPKTSIKKLYPTVTCYDCANCEMEKLKMCEYRKVSEVIHKIKDGLKRSIPDQNILLEKIKDYI